MKAVGWVEGNGSMKWLGNKAPAEGAMLFVEVPKVEEDPGDPIGYTLEPIYATKRGMITTQAFILCSSCGDAISSNRCDAARSFVVATDRVVPRHAQ